MNDRQSQGERRHVAASVLIVGMGALGCPAAAALARAGIDALTLIDPDVIELSNLQRQPLYVEADVGRPKVAVAAERLSAISPTSRLAVHTDRLDENNAETLIARHDLVIDACDDPATKYAINRTAVRTRTPYVYGGVVRTTGQTLAVLPGRSACLECVFAEDDRVAGNAACSEMGILAPVAGVVGTLQALSALRLLHRDPQPAGRLTIYSLQGERWRFIDFPRDVRCRACASLEPILDEPRRLQTCPS